METLVLRYKLSSVFILLLLFNTNLAVAQNTIGILQNSEASYNGYTFYTVNKNTYLIDNCGQVINKWTSDFNPGNAVYLLEDGSILRTGNVDNPDITIGGRGGRIERKDWDDNLIWEYTYSTSQLSHHHDIYPLPNGNILVLAVTRKTQAETINAGRDPANLPGGELFNEQIIEIEPVGTNDANIVWEWNVWDHLIQDFDNTKDNFGIVAENPQLLDINYLGVSSGGTNWIHANSIQYNESLDQIIISARQLDEFYIIDHSTTTQEAASNSGGNRGKGGDLLYRWGNPEVYGQGTSSDKQLFGQHYPHVIPENYPDGGKIILYNNGSGRTPFFSSVEIIDPPQTSPGDYIVPSGTPFGPAQPDYTYTDPNNPEDFFSLILSSAQRLPNGNTLICEGTSGRFFEIDSNENIVWEYINPDTTGGILSQGDSPPSANNVFRVVRYSPDYAAFSGKDLTPGDPIEMNPNLGACTIFDDSIAVLIEDATTFEGGTLEFPVTLTNASMENITLTFGFVNNTAGIEDYNGTDIQLNIIAGTTSGTISVPILEDTVDEAEETFMIEIKSIDSGTVDDISDVAIGTILDNDPAPTLTFQDAEVLEGGILNFPIQLSNASSADIIVTFAITNITTNNSDYGEGNLQVTIPAGILMIELGIPTISDEIGEVNETFTLSVASLDSGNLEAFDNTATGTILNDDFGDSSLVLFPIPVLEFLNVQAPMLIESVEVFDLSGSRVVLSTNGNVIDLSTLATGVYVVRLRTESGEIIKKKIVVD